MKTWLLLLWCAARASASPFETYSPTNRVLFEGGGYYADTWQWPLTNPGQAVTIFNTAGVPQPQYSEPAGSASASIPSGTIAGTRTALIDTGFDLTHPLLAGRFLPPVTIQGGAVMAGYLTASHGTQGAGIMALSLNATNLLPISISGRSMEDYAVAVDYAISAGCRVICFPHGWSAESAALKAAFTRANAAGVLIVCSAVQGLPTPPVDYPALWVPELANIVLVGGHDMAGQHWPESGWQHDGFIALLAPGRRVVSLWPGNEIRYTSGTSVAGALTASAASAVWFLHPAFSALQAKTALTATKTGERLNVAAALQWEPPSITVTMIGERAESVSGPWVPFITNTITTGGEDLALFRCRLEITR